MADGILLTAEILRELLKYEPDTGNFFWRVKPANYVKSGAKAGSRCGHPQMTYIKISVFNKRYYAHRLAWLWMTGQWPKAEIDHINGDPTDNRWCNLREATRQQNMWNRSKRRNNTSGFKGVSRCYGGRWKALIHLGNFATPEEAAEMYRKVNAMLRGEDWLRPD